MTGDEWRFEHGVGPEPHADPAPPDDRDRYFVIPDEDIVFVADPVWGGGLDTWDF